MLLTILKIITAGILSVKNKVEPPPTIPNKIVIIFLRSIDKTKSRRYHNDIKKKKEFDTYERKSISW